MKQTLRIYLPIALAVVLVTALVGISLRQSDLAILKNTQSNSMSLGSRIIGTALQVPVQQIKGLSTEPDFTRAIRLSPEEAQRAVEQQLLTLLYRNPFYYQARWIGANGMELATVTQGPELPAAVPLSELQDKSKRDYFRDAVSLQAGEFYMSPLDLSMRNDVVPDVPHNPVVRLGLRLQVPEGRDPGLLLLSIRAQDLLSHIKDVSTASLEEELMLLNGQGYWLLAPDQQESFGFALGRPDMSFAKRQPDEWARIAAEPSGQMMTSSGLWTWVKINPADIFGSGFKTKEIWTLVSHVPEAAIAKMLWRSLWPVLAVAVTALGILLFGVYKYRRLWELREASAAERTLIAGKLVAERRLTLATEGAEVGVWNWDLATNKLDWSNICKDHLALPAGQEPTFDHFYAAVHPEDRPRVEQKIAEAVEKRQDYYEEYRIVRPDGSVRWISAPGRVYTKPDGTIEGMGGVTFDITARKKAEEDLRELNLSLARKVEERTVEALKARDEAESQRTFLATVLDSLLDLHVLLRAVRDKDGRIVDLIHAEANETACRYNKLERKQLIGKSLLEILPGIVPNGLFEKFCQVIETGEPLVIDDFPYQHEAQGVTRWFDMRGVRVDDMLSLTGRDVTDNHMAAREIDESRARFRMLAENASDVVLQQDTQGIVQWITPSAVRQLGHAPEELVGRPFRNLVHPEDWDEVETLEAQLRKGAPASVEVRLRIGDDGYQWFLMSMRPLTDERGATTGFAGGLRDIQQERQAREAVKTERVRLKTTLDSLLDPHVLVQPVRDKSGHVADFIYADANPAACEWVGADRDNLLGRSTLELFPALESTGLMKIYRDTAETGRPAVIDDFPFPVGETTRWLDIRAVRVDERVSFIWRDVTERHDIAEKIAASEELYRLLASNSSDVVMRIDEKSTIVWVSPSLKAALGWDAEEWVGRPGVYPLADNQGKARFASDKELIKKGHSVVNRVTIIAKDGTSHWVEIHAGPYRDRDGKINGLVASFRIVDKEMEAEQLLERQAKTDALTGLCNRREFEVVAHRELSRAQRAGSAASLLMMDIDKFKSINDTHGHDAGDEVLKAIARACAPHLREVDTLARLGGEEFAVLLPETPLEGARHVAERIREALADETVSIGNGNSIHFTVSIGTAEHDGTLEDLPAWIKRADEALYRAKNTGRNRVCLA